MKSPAINDAWTSRTLVRLVFLAIFLIFSRSTAQDFYRLKHHSLDSNTTGSVNSGSAIVIGRAGDVFTLFNPSGRVAIVDNSGLFCGEFDPGNGLSNSATDIASDGGTGLFICNPMQNTIAHLGRNGASLSPVVISSSNMIEPISLTTLQDGRIIVLNKYDGDLWRIERDGKVIPLLISPRFNKFDNARLETTPDEKRVVVLQNDHLRLIRTQGESLPSLKLTIAQPKGLAVTSNGAWIVGDGLEFIPFNSNISRLNYPVDSLISWQIYPPADIAIDGNRMVILSIGNSNFLQIDLERVQKEQP